MIWFVADYHFGHEGILTHHLTRDADFGSVGAMDDAMIDGTNAVVKPNDTLYVIGDFGWKSRKYGHYRVRLNVRQLHIIRGNHDRPRLARFCSTFTDMKHIKVQVEGLNHRVKIHMCHYPILSWDAMHRGGIHLYGHCHGMSEARLDEIHPSRRSMDVGIDNIHRLTGEWRPISFDEVFDRFGGTVVDRRLPGPFEETG